MNVKTYVPYDLLIATVAILLCFIDVLFPDSYRQTVDLNSCTHFYSISFYKTMAKCIPSLRSRESKKMRNSYKFGRSYVIMQIAASRSFIISVNYYWNTHLQNLILIASIYLPKIAIWITCIKITARKHEIVAQVVR